MDLVHLDADHRDGPFQSSLVEALATMGVTADMRHAPVVERAPAAGIGVVVDHDHRGAAEGELLHGTKPDALQPADDDVTLHVVEALALHAGMVPGLFVLEVAAV